MRKALALALVFAAACSGDKGGTHTVSVASVQVSPLSGDLYVADSLPLTATVRDANGGVLSGRVVTWASANPDVASVANGWLKGVSPGSTTITATSEGHSGQIGVTVTLVPIASVALSKSTLTVQVGGSQQLTATVTDLRSKTITEFPASRPLEWRSSDNAKITVSGNGLTVTVAGVAAGTAIVTAAVGGVSANAQVTATTAQLPQIAGIAPALLAPGVTATITGSNFSADAVSNLVTIDGVAATVTAATPTQITAVVPPASTFACQPTHDATIEVTAAGLATSRTHPLQVATQRALSPGQSVILLDPAAAACNELSQTGGRYLVTVFNTNAALGASRGFQLHGAAAIAPGAAVAAVAPAPAPVRALSAARAGGGDAGGMRSELRELRRLGAVHRQDLEAERQLFRLVAPALRRRTRRAAGPLARQVGAAARDIATVGAMSSLNIPNRKRIQPGKSLCDTPPLQVRARTVYVGSRAIILEDSLNVTFGQMDSYFEQIGQEFDNVMFPILTTNFGSPLAWDDSTDHNGKILMLFSKQINDMGDIYGFVTACDLLDPAENYGTQSQPFIPSASNKAEIFYAIAPTSTASGYPSTVTLQNMTRDDWRRRVRGTTIHESKHLTMFAERFASPTADVLEESWLEEGTAMLSEELFARTVTGAQWKGNTPYGSASAPNFLYCEVRRPGTGGCSSDSPRIMLDHFAWLYDYYSDVENRSMLGSVNGDGSFYGSAWLFVRWLIDQYSSDPVFLKALVAEPHLAGVSNIVARAGRPFDELLGDFMLAIALDDRPGFAPGRSQMTVPSWNVFDNFAGLSADFSSQGFFVNPAPLRTRPVGFGDFSVDVPILRPGTAAFFMISGAQSAKQLIDLHSASGAAADPALRLAIVRVE